jgi:hypothetical protein
MARVFKHILILLSLHYTLSNCAPKIVKASLTDPKANLAKYLTFKQGSQNQLMVNNLAPLDTSELNQILVQVINKNFQNKGYTMVMENPELVFNFETEFIHRQMISQFEPFQKILFARAGDRLVFSPNNTQEFDYRTPRYRKEGHIQMFLIISLKEQQSNEVLWQGWRVARLGYNRFEKSKIETRLEKSVKKIFTMFPRNNQFIAESRGGR